MACPFCGSEEIIIKTPFVKSVGDVGEYEPETTYCCDAQKKNAEYVRKNYGKNPDNQPDLEDISKI